MVNGKALTWMEHGRRSGSGRVFGVVRINWAEQKSIEADFN